MTAIVFLQNEHKTNNEDGRREGGAEDLAAPCQKIPFSL